MKNGQKLILAVLGVVLLASLLTAVLTRGWGNYRERMRVLRATSARTSSLVDTRELDTAQQLSQLAVTHSEIDYAQQALELADRSVDSAFEAALRDASDNPAPLTPQTRELAARIKSDETALNGDQDRVHATAAKARESAGRAAVYATWLTFVDVREKAFLHGIFVSIFWILLIATGVLVSNYSVQRFFADVTPERRELHTMRTVALVVIQGLGVGAGPARNLWRAE